MCVRFHPEEFGLRAEQMLPEPIMNEWPLNRPEGEAWETTNRQNTSP